MSQCVQQTHSASIKGSCHSRDCSPQPSSHNISIHHVGSHITQHRGLSKVHHGAHQRSASVHGGSGGKGISLSKYYSSGYGCDFGSHITRRHFEGNGNWNNDSLLCFNEKETMQVLNDRLASYLEKVCKLEQENSQLESYIREWYDNYQPNTTDYSNFLRTIKEFQGQISAAYTENASIFLQVDNSKLAADDFKDRLEMEQRLRNNVEGDLQGLKRVLERISMETCDLQMQVQNLLEDLEQMKRNHEEEVNCLRTQLGARVSVEVDAAPCMDLNGALSEIRQQYENLMERNLREVENIFLARSEELSHEVISGAEQLQLVASDLLELRRTLQTLEIELQSQLSLKSALEDTLAETEATYGSQLAQLQNMINNVEAYLAQVRSDLERQNLEYKILMDQKTHLEMEIATYKRLLDGHDTPVSGHQGKGNHHVKFQHVTEQVQQAKC
ncbi:keratin, type I cytoskeletal 19-like [Discoglossus pictus]